MLLLSTSQTLSFCLAVRTIERYVLGGAIHANGVRFRASFLINGDAFDNRVAKMCWYADGRGLALAQWPWIS